MQVKQKGFTLIELLVVISLLMITAGVTTDIVLTLVRSYSKTKITNEIEQVGNFAITKMEKELRSAKSVISPNVGVSANEISFLYSPPSGNDRCVKYSVLSNSMLRSEYANATCMGTPDGAVSGPIFAATAGGVRLATTPPIFQRVSASPDVVKIVLVFEQFEPSGATPAQFTGNIRLEQTVVVRGTYN